VIKLWLVPGRDDDIIAFLARAAPGGKSAAVVQAMRGGLTAAPAQVAERIEVTAILDGLGQLWG
jgi:16S rRNA C967 or C1407 C5-methylase (RsmB/RsmF family)